MQKIFLTVTTMFTDYLRNFIERIDTFEQEEIMIIIGLQMISKLSCSVQGTLKERVRNFKYGMLW